ncbi:hypothetical protein HAX54_025884, partial [Datura stramonium]|nr:hypothetical protein [Datura stramonium]
MAKKHASSSASRSKAPVGRGAEHGTTPGVAAPERVQEQVVQDAPSTVPTIVPTVDFPTYVVMRLSNVLEALMPNDGRLPVPQTNSQ